MSNNKIQTIDHNDIEIGQIDSAQVYEPDPNQSYFSDDSFDNEQVVK